MNLKKIKDNLWVSDDGTVFKELVTHYRGGKGGYYPYVLSERERLDVHKLVAEAFVPNPESNECVCHSDDDPRNSHASNLWWGTHADSAKNLRNIATKEKKRRQGRIRPGRFESKHLVYVLDGLSQGFTQREIAISLSVSEGRVSQILAQHRARLDKLK